MKPLELITQTVKRTLQDLAHQAAKIHARPMPYASRSGQLLTQIRRPQLTPKALSEIPTVPPNFYRVVEQWPGALMRHLMLKPEEAGSTHAPGDMIAEAYHFLVSSGMTPNYIGQRVWNAVHDMLRTAEWPSVDDIYEQ
jgi:hypothetical protein